MQIKQFNEMAADGQVEAVTVVCREGGYSMVVKTADSSEPLRTQKGGVRQFANWEVIREKINSAGILNFNVIGRA